MCLEGFWFVGAIYGLVKAYQVKKRDKSNPDYQLYKIDNYKCNVCKKEQSL